MKLIIAMSLLIASGFSYAGDILQCNFEIADNKVKKDASSLKVSHQLVSLELQDGMDATRELTVDRVIVHPKTKKADKYLVRMFSEDKRDELLSRSSGISSQRLSQSTESIYMNVGQENGTTKINFRTNSTRNLDVFLRGDVKMETVLMSKFNYLKKGKKRSKFSSIKVNCVRVTEHQAILNSILNTDEVNQSLNEELELKCPER